jgi:hypothetical protein
MFGWLDIKQAERYTRAADRKRLSIANAHLLRTDKGQNFPTSEVDGSPVGKKIEKS